MSQDLSEPTPQVASSAEAAAPRARRSVPVRGRVFKAVALTPRAPLAEWLADLDATLARQPNAFDGRAVILDVAALDAMPAALASLIAELGERRIPVLGLEGTEAAGDGLPPRLVGGRPHALRVRKPEAPASTSLTINGSVRSGQCIVHRTGDVTVMGSVASGAEILAGGNIHVYGALRGRAIAGAARNPGARICCRKFEPELLGIDRMIRTADEMGSNLRGQPTQVWLEDGAIRMARLD